MILKPLFVYKHGGKRKRREAIMFQSHLCSGGAFTVWEVKPSLLAPQPLSWLDPWTLPSASLKIRK